MDNLLDGEGGTVFRPALAAHAEAEGIPL